MVGEALRQIHLEEVPVGTVAAWANVDRFTLNRSIKAFTLSMRAAA